MPGVPSSGFGVDSGRAPSIPVRITYAHRTGTASENQPTHVFRGGSRARYHSSVPDVTVALLQEKVLDAKQMAQALAAAKGGDVASSALRLGLAEEAPLVRALTLAHGCPGVELSRSVVPAANLVIVPVALCRRHGMLPVSIGQAGVVLAMADPGDRQAIVAVRLRTGRQVLPHVAVRAAIDGVLAALEGAGSRPAKVWRGPRAPALSDPSAPWVGVVKPPAPRRAIDLPEVGQPMELMTIAEAMDMAASGVSAAAEPAPETRPSATPRAIPPAMESPPAGSAGPQAPRAPSPPAAEVPAMPAPPPRERAAPAPGTGAPTPLALVADDDPEARQLLAKILEGLGCAVVLAGDGKDALHMVRELRPRLVVLDAMMPEIHGFEVCRAIKSDRDLCATPVVLCSAVYRGSVGSDARIAFGADAYLEKPFRLEEATQLFRHWLVTSGTADAEEARERREAAERLWRAGAEELAKGRLDEALALCWRAVSQDHFSPQAHYCLGHALSQQGMLYEAVAAFERVAEIEPGAEAAHQCLALLYERLGFQRSAREAWAQAIATCQDPARKKAMQARLTELLFL